MQVVFATPSRDHAPALEYTTSAMKTHSLMLRNDIDPIWRFIGGDPYISKARNRLGSEFLTNYTLAEKFFFLDDDVGWPPEAALKFIQRDEDVLCGIYPKKCDTREFPVEVLLENNLPVEKDGLYLASIAPTGFMCISRRVLERCAEESGIYPDPHDPNIKCWDLFRTGFLPNKPNGKEGRWWGEDTFFTIMVRQLGFQVWFDPDITFTHRGTKVWKDSFNEGFKQWAEELRTTQSAKAELGL